MVGAPKLVTTDNIDNVSLSVSNASDDDDDGDDDDDDDDIKNTVAEDDPHSSAVTRSHVSLTKVSFLSFLSLPILLLLLTCTHSLTFD